MRNRLRKAWAVTKSAAGTSARAVTGEIGRDEVFLSTGLALLAVGGWHVWPPAAFLVPGAVLTWMSLPCREPFVHRSVAVKAPAARD